MFPNKTAILSGGAAIPFTNNYSLSFDGTDDEVSCGTSTSLEPVNVSVSVWVYLQVETGIKYIISKNYSGAFGAYSLLTHTDGDDHIRFSVNTAGGYKYSPILVIAGESGAWMHVVGTYDGDFVRLYKNGSQVGSGTDTSEAGNITYASSETFSIGHFRDSLHANVIIDEVGVFDTAISAADVTAIYNSGAPTDLTDSGSYDTDRTGNLIGYWRFEEGTGTSVADSSSNSNTGTLANSPTWSTTVPG